ncbi:MAG: LacI family transcriptional regulator [Lactobacillus sp.]|jgi:LacI family kdg operon repressor|nr:LacI family transcriptional regulator [Lactobacillus sp.]
MENVTIADVAKAAGVSVTTVSRFINQNYGKMSPATKSKIENVIQKLNYHPSASARGMRTKHSNLIGVVVGDISNVFSSRLFSGIYDILQPQNYSVLLLNANNSATEETKGINRLLEQQIDGLIIQPSQNDFKNYQFITAADIPFVTVDRYLQNQPQTIAKVTTNNFQASQQTAAELLQAGYQRFILISDLAVPTSAQIPRIAGFSALTNNITTLNVANHPDSWLTAQLQQLLSGVTEKTVIVSLMGPLLFKTLASLRQLKLTFPDQVGLISFDDWNWAQFVNNGIDLIQQDPFKMGQSAAKALLATMQKQPLVNANTITIPAQRIKGHSL